VNAPTPGPFVTFRLDGQEYAFAAADVVEVLPARFVAPVPGTSRRVVGVTTWRGRAIPVLDLRRSLKREAPGPDVKGGLLVLRRPGPFGVLIGDPGRILWGVDIIAEESVGSDPGRETGVVRVLATSSGSVRLLDPVGILGEETSLLAENA